MSKRLDAAVWGQVGEVPVVWQEAPGPVVAALGFRVGRADEPLARSGLTHLVEHLTLAGLGERLYEYDGFVNGTITWFGFRGTPGELAEYLAHIGRHLADVPLDRLEAELGVVRAEEARRSVSIAGRCLLLRFGTSGWGTYDLPQYGLHGVTPERVTDWAASWFGAGNAVLWMTGEPPPDLRVDLPPVPARPEPHPVALPGRRLPAWTTHRDPTTAVSMVLPRSAAAVATATVLHARLRHVLRDIDGTSYDVSLAVDDLDEHTSHVLFTADGPSTSVVEALAAITDALGTEGPADAELEHLRALAIRRRDDPGARPGRLAALAGARLCGWAESAGPLDPADATGCAAILRDGLETAIYLVPVGTPVPASLGSPLGDIDGSAVTGRSHRPLGGRRRRGRRLVVSGDGVSEHDGERRTTVRTAETTALLQWRNGARMLIGRDGTVLPVDPAAWAGVGRALAAVDAAAAEVAVPMGDRPSWCTEAPRGAWWRDRLGPGRRVHDG